MTPKVDLIKLTTEHPNNVIPVSDISLVSLLIIIYRILWFNALILN